MKFEAYADVANVDSHLDVAAEQTSFTTHDGLDANSVTISKTVCSCFAHREVRRQSSFSGILGSPTLWIGSVASPQGRL